MVTFLAVAELGGFRAAARRLGVTPSAVSHGIRALEERVGAPLFSRTTRSVALTEAGERLLKQARPAVDMLTAGLDDARGAGDGMSGRLRINAPRAALPVLASELLPGFLARYPQLHLELVGDDSKIDIVAAGFDAGIRFGHLVENDMISAPLTGRDRYVVIGAPSYFERHGRPARPADLRGVPCIAYQLPSGAIEPWRFVKRGRAVAVRPVGALTTNDVGTCVRAALQGAGLFRVARSLVAVHLACGELEAVLDDHAVELPSLCLYYPSRSRAQPRLRAFVAFAKATMTKRAR